MFRNTDLPPMGSRFPLLSLAGIWNRAILNPAGPANVSFLSSSTSLLAEGWLKQAISLVAKFPLKIM